MDVSKAEAIVELKLNKDISTRTTFPSHASTATSGTTKSMKSRHRSKEDEEGFKESEASIFFNTDLEWPNSSKPSGITPAMLATRPASFYQVKAAKSDEEESRERTYCDKVFTVKKPPKPETLPKNVVLIQSDPPKVDIDDVEEFLVHDTLFVEFFNAFLSLPSFPEPIRFNVETGGFEVVSDGRQKLARRIKEAVRSQNTIPRVHRVCRQHSFANMALIPIEVKEGPEDVKIDTHYNVTILNKDQGIYWVKAERLPMFLESDFYFEYRLAKVISQARLFNNKKQCVIMKIDFTPRQKIIKRTVVLPTPKIEEYIVKQMYVSFGDVKGAAKESWFTQAKDGISTTPKFTSLAPQMSTEVTMEGLSEKGKKRPKSSVFHSPYFGVYTPGLMGPGADECGTQDEDNVLNDKMFNKVEDRPFTPRPCDKFHSSTTRARKSYSSSKNTSEKIAMPGSVVYVLPKQDVQYYTDSESGFGEMSEKDEELEMRMNLQPIINAMYEDDSWDVQPNISLKDISEFGSVIVGAVMKKTLSQLLNVSEKMILKDPKISAIYPSEELTCINVEDLSKIYVFDHKRESCKNVELCEDKKSIQLQDHEETDTIISPRRTLHYLNRPTKKSAEEESDVDSLIDSDEDYEEEDTHFRKRKDKWYNLTSLKGIMKFKQFLSGTPGEKYWELWVDIDKGRLVPEEEQQRYAIQMREKYYKDSSQFQLSKEDKVKLDLENPTRWCPEHLIQIQGKVLEPLVLYWAPRYLLKNLLQTNPDKYQLYNIMKFHRPLKESDPHPITKSLLPLGPKSCCPKARQGRRLEVMNTFKDDMNRSKDNELDFDTAPKVGNRRHYLEDTIERLAKTPTAKFLGINPSPPKQPKNRSRPITANSQGSDPRKEEGNTRSRKSKEGSVYSLVSAKTTKNKNKKISHESEGAGVVGKLPGIGKQNKPGPPALCKNTSDISISGTKERCRCKSAVPVTIKKKNISLSELRKSKESISILNPADAIPCPAHDLEGALGEKLSERTVAGDVLGPVKKPRDLLSPKIHIVDTKRQRSTQAKDEDRCESVDSLKVMFYRQDTIDTNKENECGTVPISKDEIDSHKFVSMRDCDFMGSERMEMLLQALHHDKKAGRAFWKFMEKDDKNQLALNCFDFWKHVQDYRKLFYQDKLDLFFINQQARVIFSHFIVYGSPKFIEISESIELDVMEKLNPAFEDLYDEAEEHVLKVLFNQFLEFLSQDVKTLCKVERSEVQRQLETKNTYIHSLQKKGIIAPTTLTPDDPMEGYVDPVYDASIMRKIPEEFRDWTFEKLQQNRIELEYFRQYLADNYAEIDLKCWIDMEAWRRTPPNDSRKRDQRARDIKKHYLNRKYFFGPSSPAGRAGQDKVMEAAGGWGKFLEDKPHYDAILEAQKYVAERLEKKHLPLFLLTKQFRERQSPIITSDDMADDVSIQKKRRTQAVMKVREKFGEGSNILEKALKKKVQISEQTSYINILPPINTVQFAVSREFKKISKQDVSEADKLHKHDKDKQDKERLNQKGLLETKWVSSTKEVYIFKQALKNPVTFKQFQKYVSIKGDNLENNLLFWKEVQHYKQMHHTHTEDSMLLQKINAINQCFIDSSIPPSLQIDIPQEMADRILDRKHEKGPYLYREAQLAIFRQLLAHWIPFCEFRSNMGSDEKTMKTLNRHCVTANQKERQRRERELQRIREKNMLEESQFQDVAGEEEDDKGRISFSYSDYLEQEKTEEVDEEGTQTIRGLPEFPGQDYRERPGYEDDSDVDISAKEYSTSDLINYKSYLMEECGKNNHSFYCYQ